MVTFSRKLLSKVCIGFSFWPKGGSPTIWMCWTIENIEQQSILTHFASLVIKFYNIFFSCLHFMLCVCVYFIIHLFGGLCIWHQKPFSCIWHLKYALLVLESKIYHYDNYIWIRALKFTIGKLYEIWWQTNNYCLACCPQYILMSIWQASRN